MIWYQIVLHRPVILLVLICCLAFGGYSKWHISFFQERMWAASFSTIAFQQKFLVDFIARWWCTSSLWVHSLLVGTLMISSNYSRRSWRLEVGWYGVSKFVRNQLLGIGLIVDVYCIPWYFDSFWGINSNSVSLISLSDSSKFQIYKEHENLDLWKKGYSSYKSQWINWTTHPKVLTWNLMMVLKRNLFSQNLICRFPS